MGRGAFQDMSQALEYRISFLFHPLFLVDTQEELSKHFWNDQALSSQTLRSREDGTWQVNNCTT